MKAFPKSLSTRLGTNYCAKMLEWYLVSPNRFIFHLEVDNKVIGYCGGFIRREEQHGSSTGMTQYAFNAGIKAFIFRPWLLFHPKVLKNVWFIVRNLTLRGQTIIKSAATKLESTSKSEKIAGLVVIGVHPEYQGKRYGSKLLQEFERVAKLKGADKVTLTVKSDNDRAIRSYKLNGWLAGSQTQDSLHMYKEI